MREAPGFRTSDTFQREGSDGKIKPDMATADEVVPCPICGKLGNGHPSMCSCKSSPSDALRKRYMLAEAALSQMRERAERAEALMEHNSKAAHEAEIALEQAQAEIASLREALGKIVTNYHSVESAEIARAALADSGEKE